MNIVIEIKMLNIRIVLPVVMVITFALCSAMFLPIKAKTQSFATIDPYQLAQQYIIAPTHHEKPSDIPAEVPIVLGEDEKDLITRTIWGEARNQSFDGKVAIAEVILKRLRDSGNTVSEVIKARKQFSCWNKTDPNREKMLKLNKNNEHYKIAREALEEALKGTASVAQGADHYHAQYVKPKWARGQKPVVTIGQHHFYSIKV